MDSLSLDYIRDIQIYQNKNGYRFSVDALLLYSFINLARAKKIADLGAGSGIIGLLLARKYSRADIVLIELQESLVRLAEKNVIINNLQKQVSTIHADLKSINKRLYSEYVQESVKGKPSAIVHDELIMNTFDLIVSNPPFRKPETGLLSIGDEKAIARHELQLSLRDLAKTASLLLKHGGRFCIIHLPERLAEIISVMKVNALEPKRLRFVHSNSLSEAKMVLMEAVKGARSGLKTEKPLIIYNEDGGYTNEMRDIYGY